MPLNNDVRLNGVDFSVVPGTYRRRSRDIATAPVVGEDVAATRARRLVLGPFAGGQRQAMLDSGQGSVTAGWDSVGVAPVLDGQGVEPFPNETLFAGGMLDTPTLGARVSSVIAGTPAAAYVGIGRRIYKSVAVTTGVWSDWVAVADLGAGFTISGLAYYLGDVLVLLATGQDIRKLNTATNALSVWRLGEKGIVGCGYKGQIR